MSRYRKIDPRIWNDEKFRKLDFFAQDLWNYILTNPQTNQIGLYVYRHENALSDLLPRWESCASLLADIARSNGCKEINLQEMITGTNCDDLRRAYHRAMEALIQAHMVGYFSTSRIMFICNFFRYETPGSHLNILGWGHVISELPSGHGFWPEFIKSVLDNVSKDNRLKADQALREVLGKNYVSPTARATISPTARATRRGTPRGSLQEQEQEQELKDIYISEQQIDDEQQTKNAKAAIKIISDFWLALPKLHKHRSLSKTESNHINAALAHYKPEEIHKACARYSQVLADQTGKYWLSHKWTVGEFLSRESGKWLSLFLDDDWEGQFLSKNGKGQNGNAKPQSTTGTPFNGPDYKRD